MYAVQKLPAVVNGRYRAVRLIAVGGMSAVYEVEHLLTGERLALKILTGGRGVAREVIERFKREARASARIKSQHVVRVIDADVSTELGGAPFLVMELLEGNDLERATTAAPTDRRTVVEWLRQIAAAIDKAHQLGIIHRDLKPENLFLARQEEGPSIIKILDFGIVKMGDDRGGITASGEIIGTPAYMAPEQAIAGGRLTPAADRYALGLVAYRLLTGESYHGSDIFEAMSQLLYQPLKPPTARQPWLGSAFDSWFARACARAPEQRFTSAAEQVEALAVALGVAPTG
jgi:serine/threonine-protein kinase